MKFSQEGMNNQAMLEYGYNQPVNQSMNSQSLKVLKEEDETSKMTNTRMNATDRS